MSETDRQTEIVNTIYLIPLTQQTRHLNTVDPTATLPVTVWYTKVAAKTNSVVVAILDTKGPFEKAQL